MLAEARAALTVREVAWPATADETEEPGPYEETFRNGATMWPRVLCLVEQTAPGWLGANPEAPLVESRRTNLEKPPWRDVPALKGPIEADFLRPLYLGESIAHFRLLAPVLSVVPWDAGSGEVLDAARARRAGFLHLASWLEEAERLWDRLGRGAMSFADRLDYYGNLRSQFPVAPIRVVDTKAGTVPAAAILRDRTGVVENALYWMAAENEDEARYLEAVLNSETLRQVVSDLQSRGQWGPRHFDKLLVKKIPKFDRRRALHRDLLVAAINAERVADAVGLPEGLHFVRARQLIRKELERSGVASLIDDLVAQLLGLVYPEAAMPLLKVAEETALPPHEETGPP